jgi:hypothetical protein
MGASDLKAGVRVHATVGEISPSGPETRARHPRRRACAPIDVLKQSLESLGVDAHRVLVVDAERDMEEAARVDRRLSS